MKKLIVFIFSILLFGSCTTYEVSILNREGFVIEKHTRLFQVTNPMLDTIQLEIVSNLSDSQRGEGGFGSTGS